MRGCQGPHPAPGEAETCWGPVRQLASRSCGLAAGPQGPEMSEEAGTPVIWHMEAGEGRREKKGKRGIQSVAPTATLACDLFWLHPSPSLSTQKPAQPTLPSHHPGQAHD